MAVASSPLAADLIVEDRATSQSVPPGNDVPGCIGIYLVRHALGVKDIVAMEQPSAKKAKLIAQLRALNEQFAE